MFTRHNVNRFPIVLPVLCISLLIFLMPTVLVASSIPRIWTELYKELNNGVMPTWKGRNEAHAWAENEKERLEPLVVEIIRGERADAQWSGSVLFVAQVIPTIKIRDVLLFRVQELIQKQASNSLQLISANVGAFSRAIDVFAKTGDIRILPMVLLLLDVDNQAYEVLEHCVLALRTVGNRASVKQLRSIPLRQRDTRFDRLCALTEKIIEARVGGKIFPPETSSVELKALTTRFLSAFEVADLQIYAACFPWRFHSALDDGDMHEFLDGEHGQPAIDAIKIALGASATFEIDRETLQAKLACDGRYILEFIYEVDGWKILNIKPVPSSRPRNELPAVTYPNGKNTKRYFYGKTAKDRKKLESP